MEIDMNKVMAALTKRGVSVPSRRLFDSRYSAPKPDMAKVTAKVRESIGQQPSMIRDDRPLITPAAEDASRRKYISSLGRKCTGFSHPHFHQ